MVERRRGTGAEQRNCQKQNRCMKCIKIIGMRCVHLLLQARAPNCGTFADAEDQRLSWRLVLVSSDTFRLGFWSERCRMDFVEARTAETVSIPGGLRARCGRSRKHVLTACRPSIKQSSCGDR